MAMQRWEYLTILVRGDTCFDGVGKTRSLRVLSVPDSPYDDHGDPSELLQELGDLGWELAGVAGGSSPSFYRLFLKRSKP